MWVPPEIKDPVCLHHPTRKSVGFYGAVRLRDGKLVARAETGRFDAQTCWDFLELLKSRSVSAGRRVVVIADNAKYHHANLHAEWRKQVAAEFELDFLPPYSPELNPIERVWKLTRRLRLHNQYFSQLDEVIESVQDQFDVWSRPNTTLRRLCSLT